MTPTVNYPPDLVVLVVREQTRGRLRQLKSYKETKHIPVLLIVFFNEADIPKEFTLADEILYLPLDLNELANKVGNLLD